MRKASKIVVTASAVMCLLLTAGEASAANTVTIAVSGHGATVVTCNGTLNVDAGWSISMMTLYCYPTPSGPEKSKAVAGWDAINGTWSNTTMDNLTTNTQYAFYVKMVVTMGVNMQTINSGTVNETPR